MRQDGVCQSTSCSGSECLQIPHCPEFLKRYSSWVKKKKKNTLHYSSPQEFILKKELRQEPGQMW